MSFANSIHSQHLGTTAGHGLASVFKLLNRKGLQETSIKGPFHHHLHEALLHTLEAHILCCWLTVSGKASLTKLLDSLPAQLKEWAEKIEREYALEEALNDTKEGEDDTFWAAVMFMWDMLLYLELYVAMRAGDVGWMELLLGDMLFRFSGGGNPKYAILILELIQCLQNEWPDDIKRVPS